jgi:hypothetical protein
MSCWDSKAVILSGYLHSEVGISLTTAILAAGVWRFAAATAE